MKVKVIKQHPNYPLGVQDIPDARANYLLRVGVAEKVEQEPAKEKTKVKVEKEKTKKQPAKEKKERKPAKEKVKKTK